MQLPMQRAPFDQPKIDCRLGLGGICVSAFLAGVGSFWLWEGSFRRVLGVFVGFFEFSSSVSVAGCGRVGLWCGAGGGLGSIDVFKKSGLQENVELVARQTHRAIHSAAAGVLLRVGILWDGDIWRGLLMFLARVATVKDTRHQIASCVEVQALRC